MPSARERLWPVLLSGLLGCNAILGIDEAEPIEPRECGSDADCDDDNPCTEDDCNEARCAHTHLDGDPPSQIAGDCQRIVCQAGAPASVADDADAADDGLACTTDACAGGAPSHTPLPAGTPCAEPGGVLCDAAGQCVECVTNLQCALPETCGGGGTPGACGCTPIPCASVGLTCGFYPESGCGGPLDCNDMSTNGAETDVDCGGEVTACTTRCPDGKSCATGTDCAEGICASGVCNAHVWLRGFGDADAQRATAIATTAAGEVLVAGDLRGTMAVGGAALQSAGGADLFVAKLDAAGNAAWAVRFGDAATQQAHGVAVDGDGNVVVVGAFAGAVDFGQGVVTSGGGLDGVLLSLDASGAPRWSVTFGGAGDQEALAVAVGDDGAIYLAGAFEGTTDLGGGPLTSAGSTDVLVASFTAAGAHLWSRRFGDAAEQRATSIAARSHLAVAGSHGGALSFGGDSAALTANGPRDGFVARLDPAGVGAWALGFGNATAACAECVYGVALDATGDVVLVGDVVGTVDLGGGPLSSAGGSDVLLAKLDGATGGHVFSARFGDAADQHGRGVAVGAADSLVVCGSAAGSLDLGGGVLAANGGQGAFAARFDAGGLHVQSQMFGDDAVASGVAVTGDDLTAVTGWFAGSLDLAAGTTLASEGDDDVFVANLGW